LTNINDIIKKVLDAGNIIDRQDGEKTIEYSDKNLFILEDLLPIINDVLCKNTNLDNKLKTLRYSNKMPNLINLFLKMKLENTNTYDTLEKYVLEELDKISKDHPMNKYDLYYLVNIDNLPTIKFKFKDFNIEFISDKSKMSKIIGRCPDDLFKYKIEKPAVNYSIINIVVHSRTATFAEYMCTEVISFILGLLFLIKYYHKTKRTYVGEIKPLSMIKLIYVFVFKNNIYEINYQYQNRSTIKLINNSEDITLENINLIKKMLRKINKLETNQKNYFESSISNYFVGLSEQDLDYSYFKLWVGLELLVNFNKKGKDIDYKTLGKRLKAIYKDKYIHSTIDRLVDLRHNYVHTSAYRKITENDRNWLKLVYEGLFYYIYYSLPKYSLDDIAFVLDNFNYSSKELENNKKLVSIILKMKKKEEQS